MVGSEPENFELAKLRQVLGNFKTAMLVTHGSGGELHGRPMAVAHVEENCDLWFLTGADTPKIHDIQTNNRVLITFQERDSRFVSLSGKADIVRDSAKIDALWQESFKNWFPDGKDSDLMLIRVLVDQGEYWDNAGINRIAFVMESLRSLAENVSRQIESGRHGRVGG